MITNNNKGMTLIEIIIAIALLGIVAIGMLVMLKSGFSFIARAGDISKRTYTAQTQVESALAQKNIDVSATNVVIKYHDGSEITSLGKVDNVTVSGNGTPVIVKYFQPTY